MSSRDLPGHVYLMFDHEHRIVKVGMTTQNPDKYLRSKYRPKQVWKKICVVPVEKTIEAERLLIAKCRTFLPKADGNEYYFCDIFQLDVLMEYMLNNLGPDS